MSDQDDRTPAAGLILLACHFGDRALLVIAVNRRGDTSPSQLLGKSVEADRNVENVSHQIDMRVRRLGVRWLGTRWLGMPHMDGGMRCPIPRKPQQHKQETVKRSAMRSHGFPR
jgi:hypothetical protein